MFYNFKPYIKELRIYSLGLQIRNLRNKILQSIFIANNGKYLIINKVFKYYFYSINLYSPYSAPNWSTF